MGRNLAATDCDPGFCPKSVLSCLRLAKLLSRSRGSILEFKCARRCFWSKERESCCLELRIGTCLWVSGIFVTDRREGLKLKLRAECSFD